MRDAGVRLQKVRGYRSLGNVLTPGSKLGKGNQAERTREELWRPREGILSGDAGGHILISGELEDEDSG